MNKVTEYTTKKMLGGIKLLAIFLSLSFSYAWAQSSHGGGTLRLVEAIFNSNQVGADLQPSQFVELLGQTDKLQGYYSRKNLILDNDVLSINFQKTDGSHIQITTLPGERNALQNGGINFSKEAPLFVTPESMVSMLAEAQQAGYDQATYGELFVNQVGGVPVLVFQKNVGGVFKSVAILPSSAKELYGHKTSLDIIEETRPTGF